MKWLSNFLLSSIGQKLIMSLTGIFFITFLVVHLAGNLQLLVPDDGRMFNLYADKMKHTMFIKVVAYGLYAMIILHAILGLVLYAKNKKATGPRYAKSTMKNATWTSKNMAWLGLVILIFLFLHMGDFWFKMKFNQEALGAMASYDGKKVLDLYSRVDTAFANPLIVLAYLVGVAGLYFHLIHGFQSAFQTLGLNHKKYTPIIKGVGTFYSVLVSFGFAAIPVIMYLKSLS